MTDKLFAFQTSAAWGINLFILLYSISFLVFLCIYLIFIIE